MDSRASAISNHLTIRKERPRDLLLSGKAGVRTGYVTALETKTAVQCRAGVGGGGVGEVGMGVRLGFLWHTCARCSLPTHSLPETVWQPSRADQTPDLFGFWQQLALDKVTWQCQLFAGSPLVRGGANEALWCTCRMWQGAGLCYYSSTSRQDPLADFYLGGSFPKCLLRLRSTEPSEFVTQKPPWDTTAAVSLLPRALGWAPPRLTCYHKDKRGHS